MHKQNFHNYSTSGCSLRFIFVISFCNVQAQCSFSEQFFLKWRPRNLRRAKGELGTFNLSLVAWLRLFF